MNCNTFNSIILVWREKIILYWNCSQIIFFQMHIKHQHHSRINFDRNGTSQRITKCLNKMWIFYANNINFSRYLRPTKTINMELCMFSCHNSLGRISQNFQDFPNAGHCIISWGFVDLKGLISYCEYVQRCPNWCTWWNCKVLMTSYQSCWRFYWE